MRTQGCGHGECTTADTPCRYGQPTIGTAMSSAPAGGTAEVWLRMNGATQPDGVRWTAADLDRCEHGRHSADHCFDCPGGHSTGNLYLQTPSHYHEDGWKPRPGDMDRKRVRLTVDGRVQVRIGTMVRGEPIWVTTHDKPREASVTEEEADGKLPCSACGHRVRPGRHSLEQCVENQRADAAGDAPADIDKEQNDGE